ncbi:hypothetical protein OUZ56_022800 [Daphnia magna]|uniref:Uncharacterized protein n=1 Tax=Daphnia magna TaxID=35525 RepID=A0ABR0AXI3_9CRUS|nr:hypothetical protein OUZ56_022800 [Daphnia magna]
MGYQHPATPSDVLDDSFSGRLNRSRFRVTRPTLARLCCKFRDLAAAQLVVVEVKALRNGFGER